MAETRRVSTAVFRAEEQGVDAVANKLGGLANAAGKAEDAAAKFTRSTEVNGKRLGTIQREFDALQRNLEGSPGAWRSFERGVSTAGRALDAGKIDAQEYAKVITDLQARLQKSIAPRLGLDVNQSGVAKLLGDTKQVSAASRAAARDLLAQSEAAQRASADQARANEAIAAQVARIRAEIDPLAAAQARFNQEIAEYNALAASGHISSEELAGATAMASGRFDRASKSMVALNDNAKLTSNQMLNLSRQMNDVLTMGFMGAPLTQIAASQAGQIYGALEEGPRGLRGSLEAIKNMAMGAVSAIGPLNLAFAGLGVVGTAAIFALTRGFPDASEVAEAHGTIIDRLKARYEGLAGAIDIIRRESPNALRMDLLAQQNDAAKLLEAQSAGAAEYSLQQGLQEWDSPLRPIEAQVRRLQAGLRDGTADVAGFREEMARLYNEAGTTEEMRAAIRAVEALTRGAFETEQQIKELEAATRKMSEAFQLFQHNSRVAGQSLQTLKSAAPSLKSQFEELTDAYTKWQEASKDLIGPSQVPDLYKRSIEELSRPARESLKSVQDSLSNLDLSPLQKQIADTTQEYDRRIAEYKRTVGDAIGLAALQAEKEAALQIILRESAALEETRRAGYQLDLNAITARTLADKAAIAAARTMIDLRAQNITGIEAEKRAQEQANLVIAQGAQEAADALREAQQARDTAGLAGYEQQLATINARYREQIELASGSADAIRDLQQARILEIETLQINTRRDLFDRQESQLRSLQVEADHIRSTNDARRQAMITLQAENDLRQTGIELNTDWAKSYVANAKALSDYEDSISRVSDAWGTVRDAGEDAIDGLMDALSGGDIEDAIKQLAQSISRGLLDLTIGNPLKNALLGTNYGTWDDLMNGVRKAPGLSMPGLQSVATMQVSAAVVNVSGGMGGTGSILGGGSANSNYAPGAIESSVLPPLKSAAGDLNAAAKAIRTIESGSAAGNYSALGPLTKSGDRAYGAYQMMGNNIPSWSKAALGRQVSTNEFLANPNLQDQIFAHRFGGYMGKYGPEGASRAWFAGEGGMNRMGASDVVGTSVAGYNSRFGKLYQQHMGGATDASSAIAKQMQESGTRLAEASKTLSSSSQFFAQGFDMNTKVMIDGMEGTVGEFLPKFGGNLDKLLESVSGGVGGGLGGLGGLVSSLFGLSPRAAAATAAGKAGLWSTGGYTGPGGVHEPAGVVHRGEVVWSQRDIARAGGVATVEAMRLGMRGYASGGLVAAPSFAAMPAVSPAVAASGPGVQINIVNQTDAVIRQEERQNADGTTSIDIFVDRLVSQKLGTRGTETNKALRQGYGAREQLQGF